MKNHVKLMLLVGLVVNVKTSFAQEWLWVADNQVLNPSGIEIQTRNTQFQVLDWNGDGLWDFLINDLGTINYYEQLAGQKPFWILKDLNLPEIGFNSGYYGPSPKNFEFIDWDGDNDFDLASDGSQFWWNTGSNDHPLWVKDDSLFKGIEFGYDFFFCDYDEDGDWDAAADEGPYESAHFYLNAGTNMSPEWSMNESLKLYGASAKFLDLNSDSVLDLMTIQNGVITGGLVLLELSQYLNNGSAFNPQWEYRDEYLYLWISEKERFQPAYYIIDYNSNNLFDVVNTDWKRHISVHLNRGTIDSSAFMNISDILLGHVNVESNARPVLIDLNNDNLPDLLVAENFIREFFYNYFHDGRIRVFQNRNGYFDPGFELNENIPNPFNTNYNQILKKCFTLNFADVDEDEDQDYLLSYLNVNTQDQIIGSSILYFQNIGTKSEPNWQPDSSRFEYFLEPDSQFYAPELIDIDLDGDLDLFIQRHGEYTFYERMNTPEESWLENTSWLTGLESKAHYSAVFADLTRDGKEDMVFGEFNGTLSFYENVGSRSNPIWNHVGNVFEDIHVDSLAAPAFADLNNDNRLDLVVGNADGWLFYYVNESTVDVSAESEISPENFHLFQNYPNPFNPETTINYEITVSGQVRLAVYNLLGQRVRTLVDTWQPTGNYQVSWDSRSDENGLRVASGVYIYELKVRNMVLRKKMILLQ